MRYESCCNDAMQALFRALRRALPRGELLTDDASRVAAAYDNSRLQALAGCVAVPADTDEVAAVIRVCADAGVPVTARGLGSATTGASVPSEGGVVVSFRRMDRIGIPDPASRSLVVEAGAVNAAVQASAARAGCFWAPDPTSAAYSTVGGNLACGAGGPRAVKYGTSRDNVLGLVAVTGTGTVLRTGTATTKGVVGYDLTRLLVGSEGTLALITEATLRLTPLPSARVTVRATYRTSEAAAHAVAAIMAGPVTPCTLEFMDAVAVSLVRAHADTGLGDDVVALLMIECDGDAQRAAADAAVVAERARVADVIDVETATSVDEIAALWSSRRALSPAQRKLKPRKVNEDVVVPVARLADLVAGIERISREHDVLIVSFGHAGNGNLHVNLLGEETAEDAARMAACLDALVSLVLGLGGTLSGEHGIGLVKRAFVGRELAPESLALMREIKRAFDPHGILNPGKVFPVTED